MKKIILVALILTLTLTLVVGLMGCEGVDDGGENLQGISSEMQIYEIDSRWEEMRQAALQNPFWPTEDILIREHIDEFMVYFRGGGDIEEGLARMQDRVFNSRHSLPWFRNIEIPHPIFHESYFIDFEDWADENIIIPKGAREFVSLEIIDDEEAIDGKSLLISASGEQERDVNFSMFMLSAEEFPIYHPTTYIIEFDVRVIGEMPADTEFFVATGRPRSGNIVQGSTRPFTDQIDRNSLGEVKSVRVEMLPLLDATQFAFVIGGQNWADIVIDNLRISQVR